MSKKKLKKKVKKLNEQVSYGMIRIGDLQMQLDQSNITVTDLCKEIHDIKARLNRLESKDYDDGK